MKMKLLCGLLIGTLALAGAALGAPSLQAADEAGNYTPATFTNNANLGTGFGVWTNWNKSPELGDSTGGGGGNINSTNGYAWRFMGDGAGGWCNGKRYFSTPLQTGDVFTFSFVYHWDGGNRGMDLDWAGGGYTNLFDISGGNTFKVLGSTVSTEYVPGAVVNVRITQSAAGIQVDLARTTNGMTNLFYTTNVLNSKTVYALGGYCGGYTASTTDNPNFALFINNLQITGEPRANLAFTSGTWDPAATGDYPFTLERSGTTGTNIVLVSSNTNAVTVPPDVNFAAGSNTVTFNATVVSLTAGNATIYATNPATGARAEYFIAPVAPSLYISGDAVQTTGGPKTYTVVRSASVGTNLVLSSSDTGVATVPAALNFPANVYTSTFSATFLAYGSTTLAASNPATGAAAEFFVTYQEPKLTLIGLRRSWAGNVESYRVTREGAVGDTVDIASSNTNVMKSAQASVTFGSGSNTAFFNASMVGAGTAAWTASNADATSDGLSVTVAAAPDFAAYDDASLYTGGWTLTPAHVSGFPAWTQELSAEVADSYRGAFIGTGLIPGINVAGAAFGLYANYYGATPSPLPEVKLHRAFPADMATGQVFSIDVGYNWNSGTKGFKLKGTVGSNTYERFELYNSGGDTWSYQTDDGTPVVIWNSYISGGFVGRVQVTCTAPNTFTFAFLREGEAAPTEVANVVLPGGIDQIELYNYNGGAGDAENFTFNRMWLSTAPGGGPGPGIESASYNPTTDLLTVAVPAGYGAGTVQGASCTLAGQSFVWSNLVQDTDYTVSGSNVVLNTASPMPSNRVVRIWFTQTP